MKREIRNLINKKIKQIVLSEKLPTKLKRFQENRLKDYHLVHFLCFHKIRHHPIDYCFMFVSGERSGRTWVRTILGKYFEYTYKTPFTINFDNRLSEEVPIILFKHDFRYLKYWENKKAVFLIRDPRDVVVSRYHRRKNRNKNFAGTISEFIRNSYGIDKVIRDQNGLVEYQNYPSEVLWVTYEDLRSQTKKEMLKLLNFLGLKVNEDNLARAVKFSEFGDLQKMEKKGKFNPGKPKKFNKDDPNAFFVRKGRVGGYKEELSTVDIEYINRQISNRLKIKNYR